MAARTRSKITPKYKTKSRVKNWPAYEATLRKRGDITVWFDDEAIDAWNAPPSERPGGPQSIRSWPPWCRRPPKPAPQ